MQKIIASSILLAGFNTPVFSQDNPTRLPDTVVTATRSEIAKNQLATAATVFTREDIDRLQVKTLPELLRGSAIGCADDTRRIIRVQFFERARSYLGTSYVVYLIGLGNPH